MLEAEFKKRQEYVVAALTRLGCTQRCIDMLKNSEDAMWSLGNPDDTEWQKDFKDAFGDPGKEGAFEWWAMNP